METFTIITFMTEILIFVFRIWIIIIITLNVTCGNEQQLPHKTKAHA